MCIIGTVDSNLINPKLWLNSSHGERGQYRHHSKIKKRLANLKCFSQMHPDFFGSWRRFTLFVHQAALLSHNLSAGRELDPHPGQELFSYPPATIRAIFTTVLSGCSDRCNCRRKNNQCQFFCAVWGSHTLFWLSFCTKRYGRSTFCIMRLLSVIKECYFVMVVHEEHAVFSTWKDSFTEGAASVVKELCSEVMRGNGQTPHWK